jgi:predicted aspartyl protease
MTAVVKVDDPGLKHEADVDHGNMAWQDSRLLMGFHPSPARHTQDALLDAKRVPATHEIQSPVHTMQDGDHPQLMEVSEESKKSSRKGLPLVFEQGAKKEYIMTGHDTGTEANHMSLELANRLGYEVDTNDTNKSRFQLPNGKIIAAIGRVTARVRFAQGQDAKTTSFTCYFNVFSHLALPALIGMAFLNATETLSKHTSRLSALPSDWKRSLRLFSIGSTTNQVNCFLNGREINATADTGAEIALVSAEYAMRHGLLQEHGCEELELADGSREYTIGFGDVQLDIDTRYNRTTNICLWGNHWIEKAVRFHVLEHLHVDVLLDEGIVERFGIFRRGLSSIESDAAGVMPGLGTIFHLGSVEEAMLSTKDKLKKKLSLMRSSKIGLSKYILSTYRMS